MYSSSQLELIGVTTRKTLGKLNHCRPLLVLSRRRQQRRLRVGALPYAWVEVASLKISEFGTLTPNPCFHRNRADCANYFNSRIFPHCPNCVLLSWLFLSSDVARQQVIWRKSSPKLLEQIILKMLSGPSFRQVDLDHYQSKDRAR